MVKMNNKVSQNMMRIADRNRESSRQNCSLGRLGWSRTKLCLLMTILVLPGMGACAVVEDASVQNSQQDLLVLA